MDKATASEFTSLLYWGVFDIRHPHPCAGRVTRERARVSARLRSRLHVYKTNMPQWLKALSKNKNTGY